MFGFGIPFTPETLAQVTRKGTPKAGDGSEVIWYQLYDTLSYVSATTVALNFYQNPSSDDTLSNLAQGGQLPASQSLQIHQCCLDILSILPVTLDTAAGPLTTAGVLNDLSLLLFGSLTRPIWTLFISNKAYGPYSLTVLHGTGGPTGWGYGSSIATSSGSIQFAKNDPGAGWNYWGNLIITQQANFNLAVKWAAAATLTADKRLRMSLFGVLNRRVQ